MNPLALDLLDAASSASLGSPSPWDGVESVGPPFVVDVPAPQLLYTPRPQAPPPPSSQQRCLPMSQILPQSVHQQHSMPEAVTPAALSAPAKRPPSPVPSHSSSSPSAADPDSAPPASKKSRATRISTADFVPPDVSGLTKREARLVKNRAAAFLSRQRKREEFEGMEVRVTELENENARLRALASSGTPTPSALSELEQLRQQLAAAEQRELRLQAEMQSLRLGHRGTSADPPLLASPSLVSSLAPSREQSVKLEEPDTFDASTKLVRRHSDKAGPSLGLMVLLFSLSTLISLQKSTSGTSTHGGVPTRFSFSPIPPQAGASQTSLMLDSLMANFPKTLNEDGDDEMIDAFAPSATQSAALQQVTKAITGSSDAQFEIDFDLPSPTGEADTAIATLGDQKIRVRIHNSPRPGTTTTHATASPIVKHEDMAFLDWHPSDTPSSLPFSDLITGHNDLFGGDATNSFGGSTSFGTFAPDFELSSKEADLATFIDQDVFGSGGLLHAAASPAPSTTSSSSSGVSATDGTKGNDWLAVAPSPPGSPIASYRPFSSLRTSASPPDVVGSGGKKKVRIAVRQGTGADSGEWEVEVLDR